MQIMQTEYQHIPRFKISDLVSELKKTTHIFIKINHVEELLKETGSYNITTVHNIKFATITEKQLNFDELNTIVEEKQEQTITGKWQNQDVI